MFSSRLTSLTPFAPSMTRSSSTASLHKKLHHAAASGMVDACQSACASTDRNTGGKSRSSNDMARVVSATKVMGLAAFFGRGDDMGWSGGYGYAIPSSYAPSRTVGRGR